MKGAKAIIFFLLAAACFSQGLAGTDDVASAKPESAHQLSWFFGIPWAWWIRPWPCPPAHPPMAATQQLAMNRKLMVSHLGSVSQGLADNDEVASAKPESGHKLSWFFPWWIPRGWPFGGRWPCPPAHPPSAATQQLAMNRISQGLANTNDIASAKPESGHELSWFFPWWIPHGWHFGGRWPWPCPPAHPPMSAAQQLEMNRKFMVSHLGSNN